MICIFPGNMVFAFDCLGIGLYSAHIVFVFNLWDMLVRTSCHYVVLPLPVHIQIKPTVQIQRHECFEQE